jgi:hypothetical protein
MSDRILLELEAYIKRAVGPLPIRSSRKLAMHDELFAHFLAIYDEELIRLGDESSALRRAKQRFGDLDELQGDLRNSIPLFERLFFLVANRKGNTMWRWLLILGCVAILVGLGFVFPAIAQWRSQGEMVTVEVVLLALGSAVTLGGLGSVAYGIKALRTP